jgi:hypothetical protein
MKGKIWNDKSKADVLLFHDVLSTTEVPVVWYRRMVVIMQRQQHEWQITGLF